MFAQIDAADRGCETPLLNHAGTRPEILQGVWPASWYRPNEKSRSSSRGTAWGRGAEVMEKVSVYLLIVGEPGEHSLRFQYQHGRSVTRMGRHCR